MSPLKYTFVFAFYASVLSACSDQPSKTTEQHVVADTVETSQEKHNAQNSLDWTGTYEGKTECNACEGASTTVELNEDLTYHYSSVHKHGNTSSKTESDGSFQWMNDGKTIVTNNPINGSQLKIMVVENAILLVAQKTNKFKTTEPNIQRLEKISK